MTEPTREDRRREREEGIPLPGQPVSEPRTGHYAYGIRDGGSEWHVGSPTIRGWSFDACRTLVEEWAEVARLRAADTGSADLRARLREAVLRMSHGDVPGILPQDRGGAEYAAMWLATEFRDVLLARAATKSSAKPGSEPEESTR